MGRHDIRYNVVTECCFEKCRHAEYRFAACHYAECHVDAKYYAERYDKLFF